MSSKAASDTMDLEDRDPKQLSEHLQVSWEEIFGEPKTIRSPEFAWGVSQNCFKFSRNCCYTCLSALCAPVAAFLAGITFACLSFEHIWCINPGLRACSISFAIVRKIVRFITTSIIIPCTEACGYVFSQIKIRKVELTEDAEKIEQNLLIA